MQHLDAEKQGKYGTRLIEFLQNIAPYRTDESYNQIERSSIYVLNIIGAPIRETAVALLKDSDPVNRRIALQIISGMKCYDGPELTKMVEAVSQQDPDEGVRDAAIRGLAIFNFCSQKEGEEPLPGDRVAECIEGNNRASVTGLEKCTPQGVKEAYKKLGHENSEDSLPAVLKRLGILDAKHPIFNIAYYMTPETGIDDIRSAETFEKAAASKLLVERLLAKRRDLTILYPASGSHISPLVIPLTLIDKDRLDSARLIFTEIDKDAVKRLELYLNWYAKHGYISGLKKVEAKLEEGVEYSFEFLYKGKPITVVFALDRGGGEYYARQEYMKEADIIIFHDSIYDDDGQATKFVKKLASFDDKPRLILSENHWGLPKKDGFADIGNVKFSYRFIKGPYGCAGRHYVHFRLPRMVNGRIVIYDDRPSQNRGTPVVHKPYLHHSLPDGAVLTYIDSSPK